jgi:hypothetical protein
MKQQQDRLNMAPEERVIHYMQRIQDINAGGTIDKNQYARLQYYEMQLAKAEKYAKLKSTTTELATDGQTGAQIHKHFVKHNETISLSVIYNWLQNAGIAEMKGIRRLRCDRLKAEALALAPKKNASQIYRIFEARGEKISLSVIWLRLRQAGLQHPCGNYNKPPKERRQLRKHAILLAEGGLCNHEIHRYFVANGTPVPMGTLYTWLRSLKDKAKRVTKRTADGTSLRDEAIRLATEKKMTAREIHRYFEGQAKNDPLNNTVNLYVIHRWLKAEGIKKEWRHAKITSG